MITKFNLYLLNESSTLARLNIPPIMLQYLHGDLHIPNNVEFEKSNEKLSVKFVLHNICIASRCMILVNKQHRKGETMCLMLSRVGFNSSSLRYATISRDQKSIEEFSESIDGITMREKIKEWAKLKGNEIYLIEEKPENDRAGRIHNEMYDIYEDIKKYAEEHFTELLKKAYKKYYYKLREELTNTIKEIQPDDYRPIRVKELGKSNSEIWHQLIQNDMDRVVDNIREPWFHLSESASAPSDKRFITIKDCIKHILTDKFNYSVETINNKVKLYDVIKKEISNLSYDIFVRMIVEEYYKFELNKLEGKMQNAYDIELENDPLKYKDLKDKLVKPSVKNKWDWLDDVELYTKNN